jgi:hypothetical protein
MNVINVIPAPACCVWIVLDGLQAPFGASGHGINGNSAKESFLCSAEFDPFYQRGKVRWVAFAAELHADLVAVCRVLIAVDGVAHFAKVPAQLGFLCANDGELYDGKRCSGKDEQNGSRDDQLEKGETGLSAVCSLTRSHLVPSIQAGDAEPRQLQDYTVILLGGSQISGHVA